MGRQAMKIAIDANVLIYFFEGIEPQATMIEKIFNSVLKGQNEVVISTVAVSEVLTGFYMAGDAAKAQTAKKMLQDLTINGFSIVPVSFEIADLAAQLRAKRGGKLPDAIIVATALNQNVSVVYSEDKDLQRYKEIKICGLT